MADWNPQYFTKTVGLFPQFVIFAPAVEKVDKIYLGNTCFIYALADGNPEVGNIRQKVLSSPVSDFLVDGHTFEVGGKSKKQKQIKNVNDAFVVKDDIESGYLNVLPLWTFGMNY